MLKTGFCQEYYLFFALFFLFYTISETKISTKRRNNVKQSQKGDKVKTYSGVYGTIVEIVQTDDGKVVTIETGNDKHKSYVSYDIRAVYAINEPEKPVETKVEEKPVEPVEQKEEKPKSFQKLLKQRQKKKQLLLKKRKQKIKGKKQ